MNKTEKQSEDRRAVAGRKSPVVNGGPHMGVFRLVKTEVPRPPSALRVCRVCERPTKGRIRPDGTFRCKRHRYDKKGTPGPKPGGPVKREFAGESRTLARGLVWRLCVECDGKLQKSPKAAGPFLCDLCKKRSNRQNSGHLHEPEPYVDDPRKEARILALSEMFLTAERLGESAARAAGLPTTAAELHLGADRDTPTEVPAAGDEDEEADAG